MTGRKLNLNHRMQTRTQAGGDQAITGEDKNNLEAYAQKLDEAIEVLRTEVKSIYEGQLGVVNSLYAQKVELLKWLELRAPIVEPFLHHEIARSQGITEKLATLKSVLEEDGKLLKRMAGVASTIAREIEKSINRNGLDGMYGKSGNRLTNSSNRRKSLDQKI